MLHKLCNCIFLGKINIIFVDTVKILDWRTWSVIRIICVKVIFVRKYKILGQIMMTFGN